MIKLDQHLRVSAQEMLVPIIVGGDVIITTLTAVGQSLKDIR